MDCSAEGNLGGDAGAETTVSRQWLLDQALEHSALSRRLIADDDDLRQVDQLFNPAGKELVDLLEHGWLGEAVLFSSRVCHVEADVRNVMSRSR